MASQPLLINNGWLSVKWAHYIGSGTGSDGTDQSRAHTPSGNRSVFAIQVYWDDVFQAVSDLLGVYSFDPSTGYLDRVPPKTHPVNNFLYCTGITSIKPMKWTAKVGYIGGHTFSNYTHAILSLVFTQPHYPIMTDTYLDVTFPPVNVAGTLYRQEWYRWCERIPTNSVEIFQIEAGTMKWAEGGGGGPAIGSLLTTPTGQPIPVGDFLLVQRNVPMYGLFSPTTYRHDRLIAAVGKINSAAFLGYPAGTLLYSGPSMLPCEAPYPPDQMKIVLAASGDLNGEMLWPSLTYDVTHTFRFRDPPPGGATRGWNLQPWRGNLAGGGPPSDMKWYLATTDGLAGSPGALQSYDFRTMFAYSP